MHSLYACMALYNFLLAVLNGKSAGPDVASSRNYDSSFIGAVFDL